MAGKHLHNNYVNCLTLRMGEKEVLLFYQIMARKILRYLQKGVCEGIEPYEPYLLLRSK